MDGLVRVVRVRPRASPLLLCLRDKFSRRRRRRLWQVKYGYCIHPLSFFLSLPLSLSSLGSSRVPKLRTQWSAHIVVDTIERHYLSRPEIKKVDHGGERTNAAAAVQTLLVSPFKWVTPNSNPGGFYDRRLRRRSRLGASLFQVTLALDESPNLRTSSGSYEHQGEGEHVFAFQNQQAAPHTSVNPNTYLPGQQVSQRCQSLRHS